MYEYYDNEDVKKQLIGISIKTNMDFNDRPFLRFYVIVRTILLRLYDDLKDNNVYQYILYNPKLYTLVNHYIYIQDIDFAERITLKRFLSALEQKHEPQLKTITDRIINNQQDGPLYNAIYKVPQNKTSNQGNSKGTLANSFFTVLGIAGIYMMFRKK